MRFEDLQLPPDVLKALEDSGYHEPTPIQAQAIPAVLAGRDVLGIAQTGTGKTAAFTLPIITALSHGRARARIPRSLVLCPTRELAAQVAASFETYGKYHRLTIALLIGGVSFAEQNSRIDRGVDVLIATPGRLLDHFERGKLMLTGVQVCVIDEADRMLDMGFIPDVERIFRLLPFSRQTLLFSATMPQEIARLADEFLQGAVRAEVAPSATTVESVRQYVLPREGSPRDNGRARFRALLAMLETRKGEIRNAIVFCNRKSTVRELSRIASRRRTPGGSVARRYRPASAHGNPRSLSQLGIPGTGRIGCCSPRAGHPTVSHVINFEVPQAPEDYVHRIGRTARAGRPGTAITLCDRRERDNLARIKERISATLDVLDPGSEPASREQSRRSRSRKNGTTSSARRAYEGTVRQEPEAPPERCVERARRRAAPRPAEVDEEHSSDGEAALTLGDVAPAFLLVGRKSPRPGSGKKK